MHGTKQMNVRTQKKQSFLNRIIKRPKLAFNQGTGQAKKAAKNILDRTPKHLGVIEGREELFGIHKNLRAEG